MRKVLIVTASRQQLPLIKKAKELGLTVVATDRDPAAPGFRFADVNEVIETLDWQAVLETARRHEVAAVITEHPAYVHTTIRTTMARSFWTQMETMLRRFVIVPRRYRS